MTSSKAYKSAFNLQHYNYRQIYGTTYQAYTIRPNAAAC